MKSVFNPQRKRFYFIQKKGLKVTFLKEK